MYLIFLMMNFGPLTTIYRYQDFDEALSIANNTRFGLAVGLVSPERELFERVLIEAMQVL